MKLLSIPLIYKTIVLDTTSGIYIILRLPATKNRQTQ